MLLVYVDCWLMSRGRLLAVVRHGWLWLVVVDGS